MFIASPGGLEAEREAFRRLLNQYHETEALEDGALFIPVGWELARAGIGRPQELINSDLRRCDYCVVVLRDAERLQRRSLEINERLGRVEGMAFDYLNLGEIYKARNDTSLTRSMWVAALDLFERTGLSSKANDIRKMLERL